eukprot:799887-Amorphochlora_amoeboformis.AAC.1
MNNFQIAAERKFTDDKVKKIIAFKEKVLPCSLALPYYIAFLSISSHLPLILRSRSGSLSLSPLSLSQCLAP